MLHAYECDVLEQLEREEVRRFGRAIDLGGAVAILALGALTAGCNVDYSGDDDSLDDEAPDSEAFDGQQAADDTAMSSDDEASDEVGSSQQALSFFFNPFNFSSSCSDSKGTNSVMAALAVATATELKRWQPTKDFASSNGMLALTATGKAQCADGKCWNTQAILDLQRAPAGTVQVRPGVFLDSSALKSSLTSNLLLQVLWLVISLVPDHKLELLHSERGGCDQFYWFNVTSPSGGAISSLLTSTLDQKLKWVGGSSNPYVQFQSNGTMVGIDPTYGLNQAGATATTGSCAATCTKMSNTDISGACCSCNGTKRFARSTWSATTFTCQ